MAAPEPTEGMEGAQHQDTAQEGAEKQESVKTKVQEDTADKPMLWDGSQELDFQTVYKAYFQLRSISRSAPEIIEELYQMCLTGAPLKSETRAYLRTSTTFFAMGNDTLGEDVRRVLLNSYDEGASIGQRIKEPWDLKDQATQKIVNEGISQQKLMLTHALRTEFAPKDAHERQ